MSESKSRWEARPLEEVTTLIDYGLTASSSSKEVGPKFLRITDIQDESVDWTLVPFCICDKSHTSRYALKPGDIVFARTGATTGKSFLIRDCPSGAVFASYLIRVRPSDDLDPLFLWHFFRTPEYWRQITKSSTGTAQAGVNSSKLRKLVVPVPPLPEQRRIAAILDKADSIRRKRQEAIKLTEEFLRSVFLDMFGDPVTNPKGWDVDTLGSLLSGIDSGSSPVCESRPANEDEWGVLKLGAVTRCEYKSSENKALPPRESPRRELEVKDGDLLFSRKNTHDLVGACAYVLETRPKLLLPDLIFRLRIRNVSKLLPSYLWQVMVHPGKRTEIQRLAHGTSGSMPNISKSSLKTASVPVAPIDRQQEFNSILEKTYSSRNLLFKAVDENESLFNSLVSHAFRGAI